MAVQNFTTMLEGGAINNQLTKSDAPRPSTGRTCDGFEHIDAALRRIAAAGETCGAAAIEAGDPDLVDWSPVYDAISDAHIVIRIMRQYDQVM